MTPELKTACEVVFQEHKLSSQPVKWSRDAFRGRISIGLCEMAKETLVKKNIIILPKKSKKIITQLNPDVASADSFEEAERMIATKEPGLIANPGAFQKVAQKIETRITEAATTTTYNGNGTTVNRAVRFEPAPSVNGFLKMTPANGLSENRVSNTSDTKWWLRPLFLYFIWPVCGAAAGALISLLMNLAYNALFLHAK